MIMKLRRLVALSVLLGTLIVSSASVFAEEGNSEILAALAGTTLSGYVDTSIVWQPRSQYPHGARGWLKTFLFWLRFHTLHTPG